MRLLALDLGTHLGYAFPRPVDGFRVSGVEHFSPKRPRKGDPPVPRGERYVRFCAWLMKITNEHQIEMIVYEEPGIRGGAATALGFGMLAHLQALAFRRGITLHGLSPAALKKWTAKRGDARKEEMISAVNERFGPPFVTDDNEADAIALFEYARQELVPPEIPAGAAHVLGLGEDG